MTERATYLAMLATGPLMQGDAIVVLAGEDTEPRLACALELFIQQAAKTLLVTGGRDEPPRIRSAHWLRQRLIGFGVSPSRIRADSEAQNTREQAVNTVALAESEKWTRILVVASPYHLPRAHLTFVKALFDRDAQDTIRVVMVPASQSRWSVAPEGASETRTELFPGELEKIEQYGAQGHVATYAEGLAYLRYWELAKERT